jgi:hypothetical protein
MKIKELLEQATDELNKEEEASVKDQIKEFLREQKEISKAQVRLEKQFKDFLEKDVDDL